jgi:hypothetical protein
MISQLLLSKRLFIEGSKFAQKLDSVSSGLAISLFQDAVEIYVWALIKDKNISVKDNFNFTTNLDAIDKAGITMPDRSKLLELNKARVNFKHYGNLPASEDAQKFKIYTEGFLQAASLEHFSLDFDDISLVDLMPFDKIKEYLKLAESKLVSSDTEGAVQQLSIAKTLLFRELDRHIPAVDHNLKYIDRTFEQMIPGAPRISGFSYIANYLNLLREISMITLLQLSIEDYTFLRNNLMTANQFGSGEWQTVKTAFKEYKPEDCKKIISILVEISIRMSNIL